MEGVDSRFVHLLQPIRDLTKNWEVDVAAQLEEYLEELDKISISFDNGKTTMNFMEAALLIQGSACIYSRKVRSQLEEEVRRALCSCPAPGGSLGVPASWGDTGGAFLQFLSLDDIPETSQASVDMRRDQQPAVRGTSSILCLLLCPAVSRSRRGEVLASRRDFRMNTSTPHASGAFLLELAGLSPTHPQQEQHLGTATGTGGSGVALAPSLPLPGLTVTVAVPSSGPGIRPRRVSERWHGPGVGTELPRGGR
uniref:Condensin-2 complex subunit H2 n=1 Tax=Junco hyemalis TaxID=40217 RepID=A0A8C5JQ52_JUNHY